MFSFHYFASRLLFSHLSATWLRPTLIGLTRRLTHWRNVCQTGGFDRFRRSLVAQRTKCPATGVEKAPNIHFSVRCAPVVSHRSETGCMMGNKLCPLPSKHFISCFLLKMTKEHGHLVFIVLGSGLGGFVEIKRKKESTNLYISPKS